MTRTAIASATWTRRGLISTGGFAFGATAMLCYSSTLAADTEKIIQPPKATADEFIKRAFAMRDLARSAGDQGFGALIVDLPSNRVVGQSPSRVVNNSDPTGHAEMEAIRDATRRLKTRDLSNAVMYSSSKPCPMCEAAAYWANVKTYYYGPSGTDGGAPKLCGHG
jgi:tRNA(Arg) A34 adenosine deaminase TadA